MKGKMMKRKFFLLSLVSMLFPMGMMATVVVTINGLEYLDDEDGKGPYIWVGSSGDITTVDGKTFSNSYFIEDSGLRPRWRQTYNADVGKWYKNDLDAITSIDNTNSKIATLKGVEYFTELTTLSIPATEYVTAIDLSKNTKLTTLSFMNNPTVSSLNISNTQLSSLPTHTNFTGQVKHLELSNSNVTSLHVASFSSLATLVAKNLTLSSLTLPTTTNVLNVLNLNGTTGISSLDVSGYSYLYYLDVGDFTSLTSIILPAERGSLKYLDIRNTGLGAAYTAESPLDLTSYLRLMAAHSGSDTGGGFFYSGSGFTIGVNLILFSLDTESIHYICTGDEAVPIDFSIYSNLKYLKLDGATDFVLPDGRTEFILDLTDSPDITTVDLSGSTETLVDLDLINVPEFDATGFTKLEDLIVRGERAVSLTLSANNEALRILNISHSGIETIDLSGDGTPTGCLAPNLEDFKAWHSALKYLDLSYHHQFTTLNLFPSIGTEEDLIPETDEAIQAYCENDKLEVVKMRDCINYEGVGAEKTLKLSHDRNKEFYNSIKEVDASGCVKIETFRCLNSLLESLNLSGCSELTKIFITQGRLTGNGDIDISGCHKLTKFIAHRHRWENLDFLLKPSNEEGGRTAEEISQLEQLQVNGGSYTLYRVEGGGQYVREINGAPILYTNKLKELNLQYATGIKQLFCEDNLLQELDLSVIGPKLQVIQCRNNMLLTLDLSPLNTNPEGGAKTVAEWNELMNRNSRWNPQVGYREVEVVKGGNPDNIEYNGEHDWVALHMPNGGYTHKLDNNLQLFANLYDATSKELTEEEREKRRLAVQANPWLCSVEETAEESLTKGDFAGDYLHHEGHTGQHLFLHSQAGVEKDFGRFKDQDLYGKVLLYKYNTGFNQEVDPVTHKPTAVNEDGTIRFVPIHNYDSSHPNYKDLDPCIEIRTHIWPYLMNLNPDYRNAESQAVGIDAYFGTICLDYDAVIPKGVKVYFVGGLADKSSISTALNNSLENQFAMVLFGTGDPEEGEEGAKANYILPAETPVFVKSTSAAGLYAFEPVWEFEILGWENLRGTDTHILHGVQKTDTRAIKEKYAEQLGKAKVLKSSMKNFLTGYLGAKSAVTDMEDPMFNKYTDSIQVVPMRSVLTFGRQTQKRDPATGRPTNIVGFWPYNGTDIPAHRCYITEANYNDAVEEAKKNGAEILTAADSKGGSFYFTDEDVHFETTGIKTVNEESELIGNDVWYNMQGVRLNGRPTQHGVYIHNGKKQTIK